MNSDSLIDDRTGNIFPDFSRPSNKVNSIIEDKTGKFWLGTRDKCFVYDGNKSKQKASKIKINTNLGVQNNLKAILYPM